MVIFAAVAVVVNTSLTSSSTKSPLVEAEIVDDVPPNLGGRDVVVEENEKEFETLIIGVPKPGGFIEDAIVSVALASDGKPRTDIVPPIDISKGTVVVKGL